ncbi:MAG TPA: DUF2141 domain-containing protein, partial [Polyangiaceae bacterium]|nr:DUF2141 domain-containing protein [Polyangiaceae bacterium]
HASRGLVFALLLASVCGAGLVFAKPARGTLEVSVSGFEHDRGHVVAKLFRRGDAAPKGRGYKKVVSGIRERRAKLAFPEIAYGSYAVFLFHDENGNGTVDHNLLGIPTEPLGFSGGFRVSLFSGVPDFDDLKFEFTAKSRALAIVVE